MLILAILAGFMIGVGAIINLIVGGIWGAIFFSLGLMTIIYFKFNLFTGKAGLLMTREISIWQLMLIWLGNLVGAVFCGLLILTTPVGEQVRAAASNITLLRNSQTFYENMVLGIFCGLLMYIAVFGFIKSNKPIFIIMPVAFFILCGFNHCVADMFYLSVGCTKFIELLPLIPTTLGNIIGCNIIPFFLWLNEKMRTT